MRLSASGFFSCAALAAFLLLAFPAQGKDAREIGDWLCSKVFEGGDATLALACDGFFGLRIAPPGKSVQNITGLWRLSPDGVELTLYNRQDSEIKMSVGGGAIHASLGSERQVEFLPVQKAGAVFRITGLYEDRGGRGFLTDAASGRSFAVIPAKEAKNGKFAVAEVVIARGKAQAGKMLKHSRPVPRLYERPAGSGNPDEFVRSVCERFWLLPPMPGSEKAGIRFARPKLFPKTGDLKGSFEISGKGLRLDGTYILNRDKLTIEAGRASVRNLEIIGAGAVAKAVLGRFGWRLSSRGLELLGDKPLLLLALQ